MQKTSLNLLDDLLKTKPVLYISSLSENNIVNLSVYANYMTIGKGRKILVESQWYKEKNKLELKDTLVNARRNKWLVLNVPFKNLLSVMYKIAQSLPRSQSEAEIFNIKVDHLSLDHKQKFPYIKGAPVAIFCLLEREIVLKEIGSSLLILKPKELYMKTSLPKDPIDLKNLIATKAIHHYGNWLKGTVARGEILIRGFNKK